MKTFFFEGRFVGEWTLPDDICEELYKVARGEYVDPGGQWTTGGSIPLEDFRAMTRMAHARSIPPTPPGQQPPQQDNQQGGQQGQANA